MFGTLWELVNARTAFLTSAALAVAGLGVLLALGRPPAKELQKSA
jgi:hypothetical protein